MVFANPRQAQEQGVTIMHQELNLIPNLSVAENLFVGRGVPGAIGPDRFSTNAPGGGGLFCIGWTSTWTRVHASARCE